MDSHELAVDLNQEATVQGLEERFSPAELHAFAAGLQPPADLQHVPLHTFEAAALKGRAIYGNDNRKDWHDLPAGQQRYLEGLVMFVPKELVIARSDGAVVLRTAPLGLAENLCANQRFRDQPIAGDCTGFFISHTHVVTAGHCLSNRDVNGLLLIAGFHTDAAGIAPVLFPKERVYTIERVIRQVSRHTSGGPDFAIVEVRGARPGHVFPFRGAPQVGVSVSVAGHPSGIPAKFAEGGEVRTLHPTDGTFTATVDAFGGNSGSPVFDSDGYALGILTHGANDYKANGSCNEAVIYPQASSGEIVRNMDLVFGRGAHLPKKATLKLDVAEGTWNRTVHVSLGTSDASTGREIKLALPNLSSNAKGKFSSFELDLGKMSISTLSDLQELSISSESPIVPDDVSIRAMELWCEPWGLVVRRELEDDGRPASNGALKISVRIPSVTSRQERILARSNEKALAVSGNSLVPRVRDFDFDQAWSLRGPVDRQEIVNLRTGLNLMVEDNRDSSKLVMDVPDRSKDLHLWTLIQTGSDLFHGEILHIIKSVHSERVLDVVPDGSSVIAFPSHGGANQKWYLQSFTSA